MRCLEFVRIPSGFYRVGSTAEEVNRCVSEWCQRLLSEQYSEAKFRTWISKEYPTQSIYTESFEMARFPVTNQDFRVYLSEVTDQVPESIEKNEGPHNPVWGVARASAERFADWLGMKLNKNFRLPTEAEWEISARGPKDYEYPYGNDFDPSCANTIESGHGATTPVDTYQKFASGFGVVDLAGNIEEWVSGNYEPYRGGEFIDDDLTDKCGSSYPILRGGSFARGGDLSRCARRHGPYPSPEFRFTGFRLILDSEQQPRKMKGD